MTEPSTTDTITEPETEGQGTTGTSYVAPASQADLDRIITDRVNRVKAQYKDHAELKAKAAELEQRLEADKTAEQRQAEELTRWQSEAEKWRTVSVASRIEALAGPDFADPSDAAAALSDQAKYLDAGGQIDEAAIKADLAEILERKPHWRRQESTTSRVPAPNPNQGSGVNGTAATDPGAQLAAILQSQLNGSR